MWTTDGGFATRDVRTFISSKGLDPVPLRDRPAFGAKDGTRTVTIEHYGWGRVGFAHDPAGGRAATWVQEHGTSTELIGLPEWATTLIGELRGE